MDTVSGLVIFAVISGITGILLLVRAWQRRAEDVFYDLWEQDQQKKRDGHTKQDCVQSIAAAAVGKNEFLAAGLLSSEEQRHFQLRCWLVPMLTSLTGLLLKLCFGALNANGLALAALVGWALGYIYSRRQLRRLTKGFVQEVEYHLPMVMERIVMGVQAGLDVVAAISAIIQLEEEFKRASNYPSKRLDPVTELLKRALKLSETGLNFELSLEELSQQVPSNSLRHALIHLALAHKEGGELVMPIKELSDSTQLCYQESVEEEIAKLPVKATLPLVCVFAGLVILFITAPVLQVMKIADRTGMAEGVQVRK